MEVEEQLNIYIQKARQAVDKGVSTSDFEPLFLEILFFIRSHLEFYEKFECIFVDALLDPVHVPWELIQFCQHEFRWQNVHKRALEIAQDPTCDMRVRTVMFDIVFAYEKDWEDAEIYEYYRKMK